MASKRIREVWDNRGFDQDEIVSRRERYLKRLQALYGHPKEKEKEELDRLLREFYSQNKQYGGQLTIN